MTETVAIEPAETELAGPAIIEDLVNRIAAELERSCHLSANCAYRAYSGKATLELQVEDVDAIKVSAAMTVGIHDPGRESRRFEIEIPSTTPSVARERSGLPHAHICLRLMRAIIAQALPVLH